MRKLAGPVANALRAVIMPQVNMMRAIHILAPTRSRIRLLGISNRK